MSNLATIYEDDEGYSPARANAKGVLRDTGSNIVALATTRQLGLVCPTDTSGGLIKNTLYYVDYDSSFNRISFEPVFHDHQHNFDEGEGGNLLDILLANMNNAGMIENLNAYNISPWNNNSLSSGAALDIDGTEICHRFRTGTTTGNSAHGTIGGIVFEFGYIISFQWGGRCSHNSNILVRVGVNVDAVTQTPDTAIRKIGMEGCDGHGTNWVLLNGNGTSGSQVVTPTTASLLGDGSSNIEAYAILHDPGTTDYFFADRVLNAQSNTNVASDGSTSNSRVIRAGIKLPTGTTEKILRIRYWKLLGNTSGELMNAWDF